MTTTRVLVTGGTGRLGRVLVPMLLGAGHRVRVLTRREREPAPPEWAVGDLRTGAGLPGAVAGTDVIIHLATTNGRADVPTTGRLIEAARAAVAPHLVYVSIVGIDGAALGYYRTKLACEHLVEHSGLPWTILRTTQFHDLITAMCDVQRMLPVTVMPAGVAFQPIDVTEVADQLVTIAGRPAAHRVPDLGGPEVRDGAELARDYLRAIGRRRPVWSVPVPGKAVRDYRAGIHLAPDRAVGRITFDDFLARRYAR
ncbi:SDR family oxidoreductase [Pseudonocardia sp. C8]|uniref:SDR family oxidoreductase n=1 Tax=Pseudonocardia sp. C8 TaxID=2762759 RepID=UPI0016435AD3|nr:SDR family oxidoreductase [Pseudonocardia sp. C8]MBC3191882.1 SDR family oxidoreductase [Pseudonocardia sp. C8]